MKWVTWLVIGLVAVGAGLTWIVLGMNTPAKPSTTLNKGMYVALGDSVAAGVGLPTASDPSACDRTSEGYPTLVSERLGYHLTNLSCSGATTTSGISGSQTVNELALPAQLEALNGLEPTHITLTVGANDIGWTEFIAQCYQATCGPALDTEVDQRLATLQADLSSLLTSLKRDHASAQTLLTGYYQLFPAGGASCDEAAGVDVAEQRWVNQKLAALNDAIRTTVEAAGYGTYIAIDFDGHELCSGQPWIQGLSDNAPYHPTTDGQRAIADTIVREMER